MSETSTATISTAITAADKQSWPLMPQYQWAEPGLSVGVRLGSMDVLGRYKCWSVKDNSPADLVWEAVCKPITDLLEDQHEHLNARDLKIGLNMFMIGRKTASSRPTILFSCENKPPRQRAMELVAKKGLLATYPGVAMAESSRTFKWLATGREPESPRYSPAVYVSRSIDSCGTPILVSAIDGQPLRKATMGGIVCIDDKYYGLTAAHPFLETNFWDDSAEGDLDFAFYGQVDADGNSSPEEDSVDITGMGSISSTSSLSQETHTSEGSPLHPSITTSDLDPRVNVHDPRPGDAKSGNSQTEPEQLGTLFTASNPDGSLDWALVSFTHPTLQISSETNDNLVNKVFWKEKILYPGNLAPKPADVEVLACTGSNTWAPSVALKGNLFGVPSFSKPPGSTMFQELWMVKLNDGSFYDGDCGSWIIDFKTGDVYGHVVSGHPATDVAYIVPATQIFQDMERKVEKPVKLSTREMRASFHRRMKDSTTNSGAHEKSNKKSTAQSLNQVTFQRTVFDEESVDLDEGGAASVISIPSTYVTAISTAGVGSLPISKEDTSLTVQAWNLLRICYTSTVEEFRGISGEICSLHIILKDVIEALENDSFNLSHTRADSLHEILDQVDDVLAELESELVNYNTMDTVTREKWQVKGWGLLAVSVIQQRIIYIVTTLNDYLSAIKDSSNSRMQQIILRALQEIREGNTRDLILMDGSGESLNTQLTWGQLKETIGSMGFTKTVLEEKQDFVLNQIQRAVEEVDLKEFVIRDEESALSPNFSSSSTAAERFDGQIVGPSIIYRSLASIDHRDTSTKIQGETRWSGQLIKSLISKLIESSNMAILEAANEGDLRGLLKLIKDGVKINTTDKWEWTALHMAAYKGYEEMVKVLIKEGADVDARTFDNETPLELAAIGGHAGVEHILEEEAMHRANQRRLERISMAL